VTCPNGCIAFWDVNNNCVTQCSRSGGTRVDVSDGRRFNLSAKNTPLSELAAFLDLTAKYGVTIPPERANEPIWLDVKGVTGIDVITMLRLVPSR